MPYNAFVSKFASVLFDYYDKRKRALPWRMNPTPYRVWVSEIMLQQTRIETVKKRFPLFVGSFPDVEALANASEERVLKEWEGMGYYSRARNMRKGAQDIVGRFHGELPATKAELLTIPGIGDYASSAISSISFNQPEIALDGNLFRVYARLNFKKKSYEDRTERKEALRYYMMKMPLERRGDFNQALMELGETICLPNGKPLCERCPFQTMCKAHRLKSETAVPLTKARKEKGSVSINVFLIVYKDMVLIRKRSEKGLLANAYEFPNVLGEENPNALEKELRGKAPLKFLGRSRHAFSHLVWNMSWYEISCEEEPSLDDCALVPISDLRTIYMLPRAFTNFCKSHAILGF